MEENSKKKMEQPEMATKKRTLDDGEEKEPKSRRVSYQITCYQFWESVGMPLIFEDFRFNVSEYPVNSHQCHFFILHSFGVCCGNPSKIQIKSSQRGWIPYKR